MNLKQRLSEDGLAIFLFHGVINKNKGGVRNYTKKHLEKDFFYRFLLELKKQGYPLSMDEVMDHYKTDKPFPPRSFAVTFDDGFENNYSIAAPILKELKLPATFYVTTGFIEQNQMSWIDCVEYCLDLTPKGKLYLPWSRSASIFENIEDKIRLLNHIRSRVKPDPSIDVEALVGDIFSQCRIPAIEQNDDPLDLKMSWEQVKELASDRNFIVGGHSHRHVNLAFLESSERETEIAVSIDLLEQRAGIRCRHYSYPEGMDYCYSDEVIQVLKNHGIVCCPTAEEGINNGDNDLFHLKRMMVVSDQ